MNRGELEDLRIVVNEATQLAIVQTTQSDHERRITQLESRIWALLFLSFGAFATGAVDLLFHTWGRS